MTDRYVRRPDREPPRHRRPDARGVQHRLPGGAPRNARGDARRLPRRRRRDRRSDGRRRPLRGVRRAPRRRAGRGRARLRRRRRRARGGRLAVPARRDAVSRRLRESGGTADPLEPDRDASVAGRRGGALGRGPPAARGDGRPVAPLRAHRRGGRLGPRLRERRVRARRRVGVRDPGGQPRTGRHVAGGVRRRRQRRRQGGAGRRRARPRQLLRRLDGRAGTGRRTARPGGRRRTRPDPSRR